MPAIVLPQILLGGLFVPRSQMADWLDHLSNALPLTYAMDALSEVGSTSIVTDALPIRAPATGTLVGWTVTSGAAVRPG